MKYKNEIYLYKWRKEKQDVTSTQQQSITKKRIAGDLLVKIREAWISHNEYI